MISLNIEANGMWKYKLGDVTSKAMLNSCNKITELAKLASQKDYLSKKKSTPKYPSLIFDSFIVYPSKFLTITHVQGNVLAGGVMAPWAIYVDEGFTKRDNSPWAGYHFMLAGAQVAKELGPAIISTEMNKAVSKISSDKKYNRWYKSNGLGVKS